MMEQTAAVAIAIRARDETQAAVTRVRQEMRRLSEGTESARVSGQQATGVFAGFGRQLIGMAAGFLTIQSAMQGITKASTDMTEAERKAIFATEVLSISARARLEELRPAFRQIGEELKFTESEVTTAFTAIQQNTRRADISLRNLIQALTLARGAGLSLAEAGKVVGQELEGNDQAVRQLTQDTGTFQTVMKAAAASMRERPPTFFEQVGFRFREFFETARATRGISALNAVLPQGPLQINVGAVLNEDMKNQVVAEIQRVVQQQQRGGR